MSVLVEFAWTLAQAWFHLIVVCISSAISPFLYIVQLLRKSPRKAFKSILITGGNSGLGESLAIAFAAPGVKLVLLARDERKLINVAQQCRDLGATVECVAASVTDRQKMSHDLLELDDNYSFDCVVANAGVSAGTLDQPNIEDCTDPLFDINVGGVFNTIFPLLDRMRARKCGQIGVMSSMASFTPMPAAPEYHASKACVRYFAEGLRPLLAVDNVGVTAICPGFVRSPMTDSVRKERPNLPFFVDNPAVAAQIMKDSLENNDGLCAFPRGFHLLVSLSSWIPPHVREFLLSLTVSESLRATKLRKLISTEQRTTAPSLPVSPTAVTKTPRKK
jgi:short-subunit dehydrogenase